MSAFLLDPAHIGLLAAYAARDPYAKRNPLESADLLATANLDSLTARYGPKAAADFCKPYGGAAAWRMACRGQAATNWHVQPVVLFKAIACADYQLCEVDGWEGTPAARLLDALTRWQISALAGYDAAPWEFTGTPSTRATSRTSAGGVR